MTLDVAVVPSPLGPLALVARGDRLVGLSLSGAFRADDPLGRQLARHLGAFDVRARRDPAGAAARLRRYFAGDFTALAEQPVEPPGTEFQRRVWAALCRIPAGATWSYAQLATRIGRPRAVRAGAAANGANPVPLFVPCHRVIAADGSLWGYGGGLARKRWLLVHEHARFADGGAQASLALNA